MHHLFFMFYIIKMVRINAWWCTWIMKMRERSDEKNVKWIGMNANGGWWWAKTMERTKNQENRQRTIKVELLHRSSTISSSEAFYMWDFFFFIYSFIEMKIHWRLSNKKHSNECCLSCLAVCLQRLHFVSSNNHFRKVATFFCYFLLGYLHLGFFLFF